MIQPHIDPWFIPKKTFFSVSNLQIYLNSQETPSGKKYIYQAPPQPKICCKLRKWKVHMHEIYISFLTFFWHHSIIDKPEAQNFKNFVKLSVKSSHIIGFSRIPRYRQKRTLSLRVFGKNDMFRSTYSPKTKNSASSLNTLYIANSAQFYSAFSPTAISLTLCFHWKREVWLCFFAENAQNDPQTHSYEDSAKFNVVFSRTMLSYSSRFRRKREVIKNFEYLCEF